MRLLLSRFSLVFVLVALFHGMVLLWVEVSLSQIFFLEIYVGNYTLTLLLLYGLLIAFKRFSHYVAWLYMLGSAIKFLLFFLLLWPLFQIDGEVSILEKSTFLIPYLTALVLETQILISKLNKI